MFRRKEESRRCGSKAGSCLAVGLMTLMLSGCSMITAGTSPELPLVQAEKLTATVKYFDGDSVVEGTEITVSSGIPYWELPFKADILAIPEDKTCTLMCHKIMGSEDVRPIRAVSEDGSLINFMEEDYDGAGYFLGNGWYGFMIPNGIDKYSIQVGDTVFNAPGKD